MDIDNGIMSSGIVLQSNANIEGITCNDMDM